MNKSVMMRMRDVALCLYIAKKREMLLSKIQLQKVIYLLDCVAALMHIAIIRNGHHTYYYGPYDNNIQNAADSLVLYGFAEMKDTRIQENNNIACKYEISKNGMDWIRFILDNSEITRIRYTITNELIESLRKRESIDELVSLVYAEPLFKKNQTKGYYVDLDFQNLPDNDFYAFFILLLDAYKLSKDFQIIPFICDAFVAYLIERKKTYTVNGRLEEKLC